NLCDIETGRVLRRFEGHTSWVKSVAISPDGRYGLSGSPDKTMRLWDLETGKQVRQFEGHTGALEHVAFSPDGRIVLSSSADFSKRLDSTLRLWDVQTGRELRRLKGFSGHIKDIAFSPDGKRVAGIDNLQILLWNTETGRLVQQFILEGTLAFRLAFSPDGRFLVSGHVAESKKDGKWYDPQNCVLKLWDVQSGRVLRTFRGHTGPIVDVEFLPDGRHILSASSGWYEGGRFVKSDDRSIRLWDVATGVELVRYLPEENIQNIALTPDGRAFLSAGDSTLRLWDVPPSITAPPQPLTELTSKQKPVARPETRKALTDLVEAARGATSVEELKQVIADHSPILKEFPQRMSRQLMELITGLPESSREALLEQGYLRWRFSSLDPERQDGMRNIMGGLLSAAQKLPPGVPKITNDTIELMKKLLDTSDVGFAVLNVSGSSAQVIVWYAQPRNSPIPMMIPFLGVKEKTEKNFHLRTVFKQLAELEDKPYSDLPATLDLSAIFHSGLTEVHSFQGHTAGVTYVAWMNDKRHAVSVSYDSTLRIWNVKSGKEEKKINLGRLVSGLAVSPDDKVAAIGFSTEDGIVELWSLESGLRIGHLEGHNDRVSVLKFSADGSRLMTSCWDMSVRTWDVESSKMIREFKISNPDSASLSPDGRMVAARDPDNKLIALVWDAETGAVIQSLNLGEAGQLLRTAFTSDSRQLVTGSSRGEVQLWDLSNGKELNRFDVHDGAMFHLGLTPDDRHLVTSGRDNALRLWNLRTGKQLGETTAIARRFRRLAISPDGRHVVTGGGSLWSEIKGKNESDGDYDVHLYRLTEHLSGATGRTDSTLLNSLGMKLQRITAGRFDMGRQGRLPEHSGA
ncbi:MAG: WD40 repeat domain-containing protein, partial [Planctomycetes bacterium]|nr:WD40 repeat domain-containing protein [Planctomycetota bacterium]